MLYDINLEKCILGCYIVECGESIVKLESEDFYDPSHKEIFNTIKSLWNSKSPVDMVTVSMNVKGVANPGQYVANLIGLVKTIAPLEDHYIPALKNLSRKRSLLKSAEIIQQDIINSQKDATTLKSDALKLISDISIEETTKFDISMTLLDVIYELELQAKQGNNDKLYTGFKQLDLILAGFHKQEFTLLAARPGEGKTALSINNIALNMAKRGNNVAIFSLEMSKEALLSRMIASESRVNGNKIRQPHWLSQQELADISAASARLSQLPIVIDDRSNKVSQIRSACRKLHKEGKLDIVFIDYVQIVQAEGKFGSRNEAVGNISAELNNLKKEFNIPVVALCQLNRPERGSNDPPGLYSLRDSGSLEQDADNVIFIHNPHPEMKTSLVYPVDILVAKQRNGQAGVKTSLMYHAKYLTFKDTDIEETK